MKKLLIISILILIQFNTQAQKINGIVKSADNEPVIGALVKINESYLTVITGGKGEFSFSGLKSNNYVLQVSAMGFEDFSFNLSLGNIDTTLDIILKPVENMTGEVVVRALRAGRNTPVVSTQVSKDELEKSNTGQDIPFVLNLLPSVTSTSDAGNGFGYTKLSVRGTDLTRINVTTNGIPLNDAESHGVWWVDLPDLSSSVENIQIQRGVGTSTNGSAAFGANINFQTNELKRTGYGELDLDYGSFNSSKATIKAGTGLLGEHFTFDVRLSSIHSDGFIDRASTDMKSFYTSASYSDKNNLFRVNVLSGNEITYQAWNGIPKVRLEDDIEGMMRYQDHYLYTEEETTHMLNSGSRTYNYYTYANQVDNYSQNHYQAFFTHRFTPFLLFNLAFNYTKGKGYYEEYKNDQGLYDYTIIPPIIGTDTIFNSDLVRRKWLDNDFYVTTWSLEYYKTALKATFGGAYQNYYGEHYGNVIWSEFAGNSEINHQWYFNTGKKKDYNIYGKFEYLFFEKLNLYADLQYRYIDYRIEGIDDNLVDISQKHTFGFFNPKFGLHYNINSLQNLYFTIGRANREPSRTDFKDAPQGKVPEPETLTDYEFGYSASYDKAKYNVNLYFMDYKNQLVRTGQINDVGDAIMVNIPESYRAGIEIAGAMQLTDRIIWQLNATFSRNKIENYTEYVDDWDLGGQIENRLGETDLSFSPAVVAGSQLTVKPFRNFEIDLVSKYVGKQYIDNSSAADRQLDAYLVNHLRLNYSLELKSVKSIDFQVQINNISNTEYETDAWVYRYYYMGGYYNMDGYFPQAGINFMAGLVLKF